MWVYLLTRFSSGFFAEEMGYNREYRSKSLIHKES